jgi:hypothetical protein
MGGGSAGCLGRRLHWTGTPPRQSNPCADANENSDQSDGGPGSIATNSDAAQTGTPSLDHLREDHDR